MRIKLENRSNASQKQDPAQKQGFSTPRCNIQVNAAEKSPHGRSERRNEEWKKR